MGLKSSHTLPIVWLHVLSSVFFGAFVTSDPTVFFCLKSVNFCRFKRPKSLSLIQLAPPSTAAFYKVIIILQIIINIFVHLLLIKANLKRCYSVANPAPDWLLLNRAWL